MLVVSSCSNGVDPACYRRATSTEIAAAEKLIFDHSNRTDSELAAFRRAYVPRKAEVCRDAISIYYEKDSSQLESLKVVEFLGLTRFPTFIINMNTAKSTIILGDTAPLSLSEN